MALNTYRKFFLKILVLVWATTVSHAHNNQAEDFDPVFLAPLENMTVTQGRDVSFTCVVNDLGPYKVAWIKSDSKAILAIHTHMVALNQRLSVTHNGHNAWKLHIAHVQLNDSGTYMCQVNTDPMRSQSGHLDVVVSPDILNGPGMHGVASQEEGLINEGGQMQLVCSATGVPEPTVQWRREDGKDIVVRSADGRDKQSVKFVEGERLVLQQVQRSDMGGYLCIASNGIPPSVSKRFDVQVMFPPAIKAVINLISTPSGSQVLLQCIVEVSPKPLNGWYRNDGEFGNVKLHDGAKYIIAEALLNAYTWQMNLTIRNLQKHDFGSYVCNSVNAMGKQDDRIRINEIAPPIVATTTSLPYVYTTVKPVARRKPHQGHKGKANGSDASPNGAGGRGRGQQPAQDGGGVGGAGGAGIPNHILENEIVGGIGSMEGKQSSAGTAGTLNGIGGGGGGGGNNNHNGHGGGGGIGSSMNSSGNSISGIGASGASGTGVGAAGAAGMEKTRNGGQSTVPTPRTPWILHSSSVKNAVRSNSIVWICGAVPLLLVSFL